MQHYIFYAGRCLGTKNYVLLEDDLVGIVKKHGGVLAIAMRTTSSSRSGENVKVMKLYELPGNGAVNIQVSSDRDIIVEERTVVDGIASCLGFVESGDVFKKLHADLQELCNVYHPDRK